MLDCVVLSSLGELVRNINLHIKGKGIHCGKNTPRVNSSLRRQFCHLSMLFTAILKI